MHIESIAPLHIVYTDEEVKKFSKYQEKEFYSNFGLTANDWGSYLIDIAIDKKELHQKDFDKLLKYFSNRPFNYNTNISYGAPVTAQILDFLGILTLIELLEFIPNTVSKENENPKTT
jgi:hypothetical protein